MDNIDDFLKSIEDGNAEYSFNIGYFSLALLSVSIKNQILLEHIVEELYPKEDERKKKFAELDEIFRQRAYQRFMEIINRSKGKK